MRSGQLPLAAVAGARKPLATAAEASGDVICCVVPPLLDSPSNIPAARGQAPDSPTGSRPGSSPSSAWWMEDHGGVLARLSSLPAPRHLLASRHEQDAPHGLQAPRHLPPILDQQQPADTEHGHDVQEEQVPNAKDGTCHIIGESVTLAELRVLLEWPKVVPRAQISGSGEGLRRRKHGASSDCGAAATPMGRAAWLPAAVQPSRGGGAGEPAWPPAAGDTGLASPDGLATRADNTAWGAAQEKEGQLKFSASMPAGMGLSRGATLKPEGWGRGPRREEQQARQQQPQPQLQRALSSPSMAKKQSHLAKKQPHLRDEPTGGLMARSQALTRQRLMLQDSQYMDHCISHLKSESKEIRKKEALQDAEGVEYPSPRGLRSASGTRSGNRSGNHSGNRSGSRSKRSTFLSRDSTALTPRTLSSAGAFERGNQAAQLKDIARGLKDSGIRVNQARAGTGIKQVTEKLTVMCGVARLAGRSKSKGEPDSRPPKLMLAGLAGLGARS